MLNKICLFSLIFILSPIFALAANTVDLNTASLAELDRLARIGPALGQRIIEARPYTSVDGLLKVKGIGDKTLQAIKKQGLAYVTNTEPLPSPIKIDNTMTMATPPINVNVAALSGPLESSGQNPWLLFIVASAMSIIFGTVFLLLKLKLFKQDVRS